MTSAYDVAQYIASRQVFTGEVQMHKLLYYVQAWSLAWDGTPMFDEPIEAWQNGPVVRSMRYLDPPRDPDTLTAEQKSTVDAVLDYYGRRTGAELISLTHCEPPWKLAWGDRPADGAGNDTITHESMRREYTAQSIAGRGPTRLLPARAAQRRDVLTHSKAAAKRWERTLDLLAR